MYFITNPYKWGLAIISNEHYSDPTKTCNPPRVSLLHTMVKTIDDIRFNVPWMFETRAEARIVCQKEAKAWAFSHHIKIRVVKIKTEIWEN